MTTTRLLLLLILCVIVSGTSLGQDAPTTTCDTFSMLFAEYDSANDAIEIQCLELTGEVETLISNAGIGSLSPDGEYITYTVVNNTGTSTFEYDMSLYIYKIKTQSLSRLRDHDGHIAANWTAANTLIISTWDNKITSSAVFTPNHRFLYDPKSDEIIELEWLVGNGARVVGYWLKENIFLFADYRNGLSKITLDGLLTPISLSVDATDSDFVMSPDSRLVAYRTKCDHEDVLINCMAVYELGTDNIEVVTAFAEDYESLGFFTFSPSGRFIVISLEQQSTVGIYDLGQKRITFEFSEPNNGFTWAHDEDRLFVAVVDEDDESDSLSYIYIVNPLSGEMELAIDEPRHWLGFY